MDMDSNYYTRIQKLQHLGDLKKANCTCAVHQMDREINLLYGLKLPNTLENWTVIQQGLKFMPQGFTVLVSSCQQFTGTASVCELIEYEVTPNGDGTFRVEQLAFCKHPHSAIRDTYIDFSGQSFVYVCQDKDEQHTIASLFAQVKRSTQMDICLSDCSSELMDEHTSEEEDVPDMVTSYHQCNVL